MTPAEPRFYRIAALLGDPTRARMLAALLTGEHRSAGELARVAGVSAQAASSQLGQLADAGLLVVRQQGRHRYFALADAEVAHALEALALVAERDTVTARWQGPRLQPLKHARRCYGHLAGELGVAQFRMLLRCGHLRTGARGLELSPGGHAWATDLGLVLPRDGHRLAYPCMDWSERQDHLAGHLSRALLEHCLQQRWLLADEHSRALKVTPQGEREFLTLLEAA